MASKNNVKALVHATGDTMKWALSYYEAYKFEKSAKMDDDMTIDEVVDLTKTHSSVTFTEVLEEILNAVDKGYTDLMIVAHGEPKGLTMKLGPGLGSPNKDVLPLFLALAAVIQERARIRGITGEAKQLKEWKSLIRSLSGTEIGTTRWAKMDPDLVTSVADGEAALRTMGPTSGGKPVLDNPDVIKLLDLRNKLVAMKKLKRIEIRACNLGQDPDAMKLFREFVGADRVVAPMVKTFYFRADPTIFSKHDDLKRWVVKNAPWVTKSQKDPANVRTYESGGIFEDMAGTFYLPNGLIKCWQPQFQTCAAYGPQANKHLWVQQLVNEHLDLQKKLNYKSGIFYVGGLDTVAGRTAANPQPASANGKAFVLQSEPEYRGLIVINP